MRARRSPAAWTAIVVVLGCSDDATVPADTEGTTQASSGSAVTGPPAETTATPSSTGAVDSTGGSSTAAADGSTTAADTDPAGTTTDDDTSTGTEICEAPARLVPCDGLGDEPTPFQAIGLGCPLGPDEAIPLESAGFHSDDPAGDPSWGPRHGEQLLVLSSGFVARPDAAGAVTMDVLDQDANDNPDDKPLPAPMSPTPGSSGTPFMGCDGVGDCSDSLWSQWLSGGSAANDLLWLQLRTAVPGGTHGYSLDFAWFSEEYPESVGTNFNDMLVVWSASETYVGNLCLVDEEPCSVSGLWPVDHQGGEPELDGTGFAMTGAGDGGAMAWATLKGSAAPHELLELTVALFDMGDEELDTLVLLDGFGWDCEGCTPSPGNPCGVVR